MPYDRSTKNSEEIVQKSEQDFRIGASSSAAIGVSIRRSNKKKTKRKT
jgi:hypothetical protein